MGEYVLNPKRQGKKQAGTNKNIELKLLLEPKKEGHPNHVKSGAKKVSEERMLALTFVFDAI